MDAAAYKYGVAATKNGITSGLTWSNCLYDISAGIYIHVYIVCLFFHSFGLNYHSCAYKDKDH